MTESIFERDSRKADASEEIKPGKQIKESNTRITQKDSQQGSTVTVFNEGRVRDQLTIILPIDRSDELTTILAIVLDGFAIGEVIFPAGELPRGAVVELRKSDAKDPEDNKCGDQARVSSPRFDIHVKNGPK